MDTKKINAAVGRTNAITFVYWDEHGSDTLFAFLDSLKTPCVVSPLHDKDVNEINADSGEAEFKKAHYHVLISFEKNLKSVSQFFQILQPVREFISIAPFDTVDSEDEVAFKKVCDIWNKDNVIHNTRTLLRYFNHKDNPEKFQYDSPCKTFGGFNYYEQVFSQTDNLIIFKDIIRFIKNNDVYLYCDLLDYCMEYQKDWISVLTNHSLCQSIVDYQRSLLYKGSDRYCIGLAEQERNLSGTMPDSV